MKALIKFIIFIVLVIIVMPIFSVFYYSFNNTGLDIFHWYKDILRTNDFLNPLWLSIKISLIVGLLTSFFGFIISLAWFNKFQRYLVVLLIIVLGLIPPDIIALGISQFSLIINIRESNLFFTVIGLILYSLPFTILLLWTRYYFIDDAILNSARDIGMDNFNINLKIVLGLSVSSLSSSILFNFLLALNEYPRTYYLSGYYVFLSEYLCSKLKSGTNESIYAGSGITILITCLFLLFALYIIKKSISKISYK